MRAASKALLGLVAAVAIGASGHAATCPAPPNGSGVNVPGRPFGLAVTRDGCWMFAALSPDRRGGALAVLHNANGVFTVARVVPLASNGSGIALTHDGRLLIVTETKGDVAILDVEKLEQPSGNALAGTLYEGRVGPVYAITSLDDGLLFVSDELANRVSVYNLAKWRADHYGGRPLIGHIPAALGPVGLALSPDGKSLYSVSEVALPRLHLDRSCRPEDRSERWHPQGVLLRVDIAQAATDPRRSVTGVVTAGCNPVRVAVSPGGAWAWVTARDGDAVLRIATAGIAPTRGSARAVAIRVGTSPVGVAVRPDGNQVWVALSDRFARKRRNPRARDLVGLIGAAASDAASIELVSEPVSGFPRELVFLPDGRTLAVGLFDDDRIEFFTTPP